MRSVLLCVLFTAITIPLFAASKKAEPADWSHHRGPDQSSGVVSAAKWLSKWNGANVVWKANVGIGFPSVVVKNGIAVTMGNRNNTDVVTALDAQSGKVLWTHEYPCALKPNMYEGGPNATPTIDGKAVYILSKEGHLKCLSLKTGQVVWEVNVEKAIGSKRPDWGYSSSPLIIGNALYVNVGKTGIAVDKRSGKIGWSTGKQKSGYANIVPSKNGKQLFVFTADNISVVSPATGKTQWSQPWKTSYGVNAASPIEIGKNLFIASGYGKGCALVNKSGVVYANKNMLSHCNGVVLVDKFLYGISAHNGRPGTLVCMDPTDGSVKWSQKGFGMGSLIAVGSKLLCLTDKGEFIMVEAQTSGYKELGRSKILNNRCWTQPTVANGQLFARDAQGNVVCVDLR